MPGNTSRPILKRDIVIVDWCMLIFIVFWCYFSFPFKLASWKDSIMFFGFMCSFPLDIFRLSFKNGRIWLTNRFKTFDKEFEFIQNGLEYDQLNNSVWNFRRFIISKKEIFEKGDLLRELAFIRGFLAKKPENESAWNYLMGFFEPFRFESIKSQKNPLMNHVFSMKEAQKELEEIVEETLKAQPNNKFALTIKYQMLLFQERPKEALMVSSVISIPKCLGLCLKWEIGRGSFGENG